MIFTRQHLFLSILLLLSACGQKSSQEEVHVAVNPVFFKVPAGGEVQFSADVSGTLSKEVTWQISGPGSIGPTTGLYRAPLNTAATTTIQAVSQSDPSKFGNGSVTTTAFSKQIGEAVPTGSNTLVVGGYTVRAGQTIDINGDNLLDLVSVAPTGKVVIYLGVGGAKFLNKGEINVSEPAAVAVGDFIKTASFVADVAIASRQQGVQLVQGKQGPAEQAFPNTVVPLPLSDPASSPLSGKFLSALAVSRFHGAVEDRNSDLVVGTEDGAVILFLQNGQAGNFDPQPPVLVGGKIVQIVPADFNGDDLTDLAILRDGANDLLILLGNGAGAFSAPISVPFPSPPTSIAVGDFDDDKINDLAAAHAASNQVSVSLGKGDGTFAPPLFREVESSPTSISVGDFNLGGKTDIAVALPISNAVLLLFGDGSGRFIGRLRYDTEVPPLSLVPGFFTSFQSPQGFQSVGLIYINGTQNKFYLLNNVSS